MSIQMTVFYRIPLTFNHTPPEWTQTARSAAASVSAACVANLAGWTNVAGGLAWFGCEVGSSPQHQNDGGQIEYSLKS